MVCSIYRAIIEFFEKKSIGALHRRLDELEARIDEHDARLASHDIILDSTNGRWRKQA